MPGHPRLAATIVLLRPGGRHAVRGLEVLMVKRNANQRFMPGVWVFPGGAVDVGEGSDEDAHRRCAIRELEEEAAIALPGPEALLPWSRWITPEQLPIRFDTRFYLALATGHQRPVPDGRETVEAQWWIPQEALEAHGAGEMDLAFPTIRHLEALAGFGTAQTAIEAARAGEVNPVQPRVIEVDGERRVVLPGEPGFEEGELL